MQRITVFFLSVIFFGMLHKVLHTQSDSLHIKHSPVLDTLLIRMPDTLLLSGSDTLFQFVADTNMVVMQDTLIKDSIPTKLVAKPVRPLIVVDSSRVDYYTQHFDSLYLGAIHTVDTSQIESLDFDVLSQGVYNYATLSNTGLAHQSHLLNIPFYNGFDMQGHAFQKFIVRDGQVRQMIPHQPFTRIDYTMGSKKEQHLNLSFARALAPRLYAGLEFFLVNAPGPYRRSKSDNTGVYLTTRYSTKNERYAASAYYLYNKLQVQESGGLVADSIFENNLEEDRRIIPVQLMDANNLVKHSGFGVEQYVNLSRPTENGVEKTDQKKRINIGRITHRMVYARNQMLYTDESPEVAFYRRFGPPIDSVASHDSLYQESFRNSLQWSTLGYGQHTENVPFYLYGGIEHQYINHRLYPNFDTLATADNKSSYTQIKPYAGIRIGLFRSSYLDGRLEYIRGNFAAGDLRLDASWRQYLGTTGRNIGSLFFKLNILNQSPSWLYQRFQSNYFNWDNDFNKSRYVSFTGSYDLKGFRAGANLHVLDRHVYLNTLALPEQATLTINVLHLFTALKLNLGKFDIIGSVNYQKSDRDSLLALPEFSGRMKFTYTQTLFKSAATILPGFSISYNTPYYANAYMPALRSFYLQDEKKIGGYPYVDVFLGLKVKRTNLYIKYTNLYALMGDYTYYLTPGYPQRDPFFYFGLSWRFYQ
jgi:hypothetical protein